MSLITIAKLRNSKPENVIRLAQALKLEIHDLSYDEIIMLVSLHVASPVERFADPVKRHDYTTMWEQL